MPQSVSQIGEMFMLGFDNERLDLVKEFYDHFGLGGVVLFKRNFESLDQVSFLISELRSKTFADLVVAVDQEGGSVTRLEGADFPTFPSAASFGAGNNLDSAVHAAKVTADSLLKIGINMNLAPVADVLTNPDNALMKRRCYSSETELVGEYVRAVVQANESVHVASCAKHFPGLGDSVTDPHESLAVSHQPVEFYREKMFPPFKAAMDALCPAIMTTHLAVDSLDADNSATFSRTIATDILRGQLRFDGVVLSDDLDMGAVKDLEDAVVRALAAGHDMVLVCHSLDKQISCAERIAAMVKSGEMEVAEIAHKIERVARLKQKYKIAG